MSTLARYWLLQIPGWVLLILVLGLAHNRFDLPVWVGGTILLLWVAKDAILYPILKPGYETRVKTGSERLVGLVGVAKQDLEPEGYVLVYGEFWKAVADPPDTPIPSGSDVRVTAAHGMLLTVARVHPPDRFRSMQ